jgi:hypothetical protein
MMLHTACLSQRRSTAHLSGRERQNDEDGQTGTSAAHESIECSLTKKRRAGTPAGTGAKNDVWIPTFAGMTVADYEFTVTLGLKSDMARSFDWRVRIIDSDIAKSGPTFSIMIEDVQLA